MAPMKLQVTPIEEALFGRLLKVAGSDVTLRVAGGWVRDRLLTQHANQDSAPGHDIDILVVGMSGEEFGKRVVVELELDKLSTFRANPEKSKHVETSRVNIGPIEIDFAMGRKETYDDESRIPVSVEPGTPEEDANRRDFTINSMFWNLSTNELEDFTGQGLTDLFGDRTNSGTIRSPGDPLRRFMDDPLRVLRGLRFSARFGLPIHQDTWAAMSDPKVIRCLFEKTARERIGEEFLKSMKECPRANDFFEKANELGLWDRLVTDALLGSEFEGKLAPWAMSQKNRHHQLNLWDHTMQVVKACGEDPVVRIAAFLHDIGKRFVPCQGTNTAGDTNYHEHEDHSAKIAKLFLSHLHLPSEVVDLVCPLIAMHMRPYSLMDASPKSIRRMLRDMDTAHISLENLFQHVTADVTAKSENRIDSEAELKQVLDLRARMQKISEEPILVPRNTCILDGNEIKEALNRPKDGPWIKAAKTWLLDKMDEGPLTKENAITELIGAVATGALQL